MTLALCGCPNCGKTTLFNLLTGQTQRTGNWPGVTVDISEGLVSPAYLPSDEPIRLIDLPGTSSLTPFSPDEEVPLSLLQKSPPDAVIVVIDSCDPAQGLYLMLQLCALKLPLVAAFNMADHLKAHGGSIDLNKLSAYLHIPCVLFSARQTHHIDQVLSAALHAPIPVVIMPDAVQDRWETVDQLLSSCFSPPKAVAAFPLDRLFLHPFLAYPLLLLAFFCVFFCAFGPPGRMLTQVLDQLFDSGILRISQLLTAAHTPPLFKALLTDGLMRSMASVFSFLPVLLLFFFCTALLEDSGYLSRAAFLLDAPFHRLHLSGRSFFPLITGCGCSVPAILSAQSLPSCAERRRAALLIPYIPCSAKLPVMLCLSAYCLKEHAFILLSGCYAVCILVMLFVARMMPALPDSAPLIMDFPPLRLPTLRGAWHVMQNKTRDFITRAFTLIFFTSVIVWLMQSFTPALSYTTTPENSLLFHAGRLFSPIFAPIGLDSPPLAAALLAGLLAKENILSILAILPAQTLFQSPAQALSFLIFSLLYAPCISACAALSQALKSRRRMLLSVFSQTVVAWLAALLIYQIFSR